MNRPFLNVVRVVRFVIVLVGLVSLAANPLAAQPSSSSKIEQSREQRNPTNDDPMTIVLNEAKQADAEGLALWREKKYEESIPFFQKSLAIRQGFLKDHPMTATSLFYIGQAFQYSGKLNEAEEYLKRSIEMHVKVSGPDDKYAAAPMVNLGNLYKDAARLREAESIYLQALKSREKTLGPDHVLVAEVCNFLGVLYAAMLDYPAAESFVRRALKIRELRLGVKHPDTARTMLNLGIALVSQSKSSKALSPLQTAFKTYEELVGPEDIRTGECCHWLALCHLSIGNQKLALEFARRAFEIRDERLGRRNLDTLVSLKNYADLLAANGSRQESVDAIRQAYEGYSQVSGPESESALECLTELGLAAMESVRFDEAQEKLTRVFEIRKRLNGNDHSKTAGVAIHLATLKFHRGIYEEARTELERALRIVERADGSDSKNLSSPLNTLGVIQLKLGNVDEASKLIERAIRIIEKHVGANSIDTAQKMLNLAAVRVMQSRFAEAEELFRSAGFTYEKTFGPDHSGVGKVYSQMALMYAALGDHEEEERSARLAVANLEKSMGPDHPATVAAINNLAVGMGSQGRNAEAEPLFRNVFERRRKLLGDKHPEVAMAQRNLAALTSKLGRIDESERLFIDVLEKLETILDGHHPDIANTLRNLAVIEKRKSKLTEAETHLRRALEISKKSVGTEDPVTLDILDELSDCLIRQKQFDEGFELLDERQRATRRYILRVLPSLSSSEQMKFLRSNALVGLHASLNSPLIYPEQINSVNRAATWWINGKAVAQESLATHNRLARDEGGGKNRESLLKVRQELAASTMILAEDKYLPNQQRRLRELVAMEQTELKRIAAAWLKADTTNAWVSLSQVKQALPANVALIDIVRLERFDSRESDPTKKWTEAEYHAFITRRDEAKPTRMIALGKAGEIDDLVKQVRTLINAGAGPNGSVAKRGEEAASLEVRQVFAKLSARIWRPIAPEVADVNQLILSPDGLLWLLPWNALPIATDKEEYLVEKYTVRYVVSPRDLLVLNSMERSGPPVIVADPLFEIPEDTKAIEENLNRFAAADQMRRNIVGYDPTKIPLVRGYHSESLLPTVPPLPNTAIEASAIQPNLEKFARAKPRVYQQSDADEPTIKKLSGPRVLSLATHGFFLADEPAPKSDPAVAPPGSASSAATQRNAWGKMKPMSDNPLLHCGLLLSGCNNPRLPQYHDDGILTGLEIVEMDLRGTELVVLSACETGLGTVNNGDGVAGLRQAFQLAGAQSVVATLWQVPDRDSALLMNAFFDHLADGQSKAAALRLAQIERIQKRRDRYGAAHPYFWSAYTLTGR